jgi:hypothetical protein
MNRTKESHNILEELERMTLMMNYNSSKTLLENKTQTPKRLLEDEESTIIEPESNNEIPWFYEHPHLSKIGTADQYSEYLKTIYPKTKVKNIVYRGVTEDSYNSTIRGVKQPDSSSQTIIDLIFFTGSQKAADKYAAQSAKKYDSNPITFAAIVNVQNPLNISNVKELGPRMRLEKYLKQTGINLNDKTTILNKIDYVDNYKLLYGKTPTDLADFKQAVLKFGGNINDIKDDELEFIIEYLNNTPRIEVSRQGLEELGYDSVVVDSSKDWFDFNYDQIGVNDGQYVVLGSPHDVVAFNKYIKSTSTN